MLIHTGVQPAFVIVDPQRLLPRYWATAWVLATNGSSLSYNTQKTRLRHLDAFYQFVDERYGADALDDAISSRDAERVQLYVEGFYYALTSDAPHTTTSVQRWEAVRAFVQHTARRLAISHRSWQAFSAFLLAMGKLRNPNHNRPKFVRAVPAVTLLDLLAVAEPGSPRNPYKAEAVRWRNWLIVNLLLLAGLRRGEVLLLKADSLKRDVDPDTGEWVQWLDVTACDEADQRTTKPSIKTPRSHRQIPVSTDLADLYEYYASCHRHVGCNHSFLLTAATGPPLSAESLTRMLERVSAVLSPQAVLRLAERKGGRKGVSPHDLRHTCATARFSMYMAQDPNRDLALQRMRAFFGWAPESIMPEHYARAAVQEDILRTWSDLFDSRAALLRKVKV